MIAHALARLRVPLGFVCAAIAIGFARPTTRSLLIGGAIAIVGELIRIWGSGHIGKGREIEVLRDSCALAVGHAVLAQVAGAHVRRDNAQAAATTRPVHSLPPCD